MEKWDKALREHRQQHHRENPSFSSTLLDAIYRSIDEGETEEKEDQLVYYRESMKKQKQSNCYREDDEAEATNLRRARKVENWMEKKVTERVIVHKNSSTEYDRRKRSNCNALSMHSSSSSSDSSSGGGFSSSESESFYGIQRPKPIRTSVSSEKTDFHAAHGYKNHSAQTQKPKHENGFGKTKSKALRILYGDLKKAKQPISPGARLASFLNSLFTTSGSAKKAKVSSSVGRHESKSAQASTCSSASSFSRSCLSKTPSSRSGAKRSVRFCPVSVIVDEDCRPCGHKNLHEEKHVLMATLAPSPALKQSSYIMNSNDELKFHVMQESRRVEEFARDLLQNYQKKNPEDFDMHSEEDDDDAASCSSSDLFELDNLSAIGIERYREELPVYETTHFDTNRAIANGFIL